MPNEFEPKDFVIVSLVMGKVVSCNIFKEFTPALNFFHNLTLPTMVNTNLTSDQQVMRVASDVSEMVMLQVS